MRRRRQPTPSSSSSSSDNDSDGLDIESYFGVGDEEQDTDADTELTEIDIDADGDEQTDLADLKTWIAGEDNVYPPSYYRDQDSESDDEDEDYSDSTVIQLDMIEGEFHRFVPCVALIPTFATGFIYLILLKDTANILEKFQFK